jgi:hypothetical protein
MADVKISALTQLTGAGSVATADEFVIVDKSDPTMSAVSGTDKRITAGDLATAVFEQPLPDFTTTTPTAPATGLKLFVRNRPAGFRRLALVDPDGRDAVAQAGLWNNTVAMMLPNGNATTLSVIRMTATAIGTAAARNWANTDLLKTSKRLGYPSAATAGANGGVKHNVLQWWRGSRSGEGGFFCAIRFGFETIPATRRWFVGMYGSTTNPGNVEPSTLLNLCGIGQDLADTVPQFIHNDGTATATKSAATGVANPTTAKVYEARIFCKPNDTAITMSIQDLNVSAAVVYSTTTKIPGNTVGLLPMIWANNGTTAALIDPVLIAMYLETDY